MGQQYTTRATEKEPSTDVIRTGPGESTPDLQIGQETLSEATQPEVTKPTPEELERLQSAGTQPEERYQRTDSETRVSESADNKVTITESTRSPRSATERARIQSVSEWRNEEVLEPTPEELRGEASEDEENTNAIQQQTIGGAADFDFDVIRQSSEANKELPDPPTVTEVPDPDGYAERYTIVDQEYLSQEQDTYEDEFVREGKLPGLDPRPTIDEREARTEISPTESVDSAPNVGNLAYKEGTARARDASRPTAFDVEYGFSARVGDTQWDNQSSMSIAGGIPVGPDDASPRDFVDEDLWELPSTTPSEMEERFFISEQEPKLQHEELKDRYNGTLDERAGNAEVARTAAIRDQVSSETPVNDLAYQDPEAAWEAYNPDTETREINGESVRVATESSPPVQTLSYDYSYSRAQRVYQSLSERSQQALDEQAQQIADVITHADKEDIKTEYLKRLERNCGTINSDDVSAVKMYLEENPSDYSTTIDTLNETRNAFLTDSVATGSGYTQTYTTRGTLNVEDISSVVSFHRENGYSNWRSSNEARADITGTVDATVPRPQTRSGVNQVLYLSNPESNVDEQLKVTIWDSGINTDERAASNNAERDASGRKIEQTKNIPAAFEHGDEVVLKDAKIDTYGTDETPTAEIDSKANLSVENRSGGAERTQVSSTERPTSKNRYTKAPYWARDQQLSKTVRTWEKTGYSPSGGTQDGWKDTVGSDVPPDVKEKTIPIATGQYKQDQNDPTETEEIPPDDIE